jgi:hypothetical protein
MFMFNSYVTNYQRVQVKELEQVEETLPFLCNQPPVICYIAMV